MAKDELLYERLTESIIGAFYEVYNRLGYGFLEGPYEKSLAIELGYRGHELRSQVAVDLYYRGLFIGRQRVDLIVDEKVIIEVKAVESMPRVAFRQCLSYLKTTSMRVGLVLNFGTEPQLKRIVSNGAPLGPNAEVVFPTEAGPDPGPENDDDATGVPG